MTDNPKKDEPEVLNLYTPSGTTTIDISANVTQPKSFQIHVGDKVALEFTLDGKVIANPDLDPDEAAREIIKSLRRLWWDERR